MMLGLKVLAACGLDLTLGDPRWLPHPVKLMGGIIHWVETVIAPWRDRKISQCIIGVLLALGLPSLCFVTADWLIKGTMKCHELAGDLMWIVLGYTSLAAKDLATHAHEVFRLLRDGSLEQARVAVSMIVGRDTATLSEQEVVRATVETVAESTSDGVVAPLLYLALGGPPLALAYKAVNTLDSMIGHRKDHYQYLGWASARCDDVMNWIPSRVSGVCLVLAASLVNRTGKFAWMILLRDGSKHESPNSGRPEAAMAGALQVRLGGPNFYDGVRVSRDYLGDHIHALSPSHIILAIRLMYVAYAIVLCAIGGVLLL